MWDIFVTCLQKEWTILPSVTFLGQSSHATVDEKPMDCEKNVRSLNATFPASLYEVVCTVVGNMYCTVIIPLCIGFLGKLIVIFATAILW